MILIKWFMVYSRINGYFDSRLVKFRVYQCPTNNILLEVIKNYTINFNVTIFIGNCNKDILKQFSSDSILQNTVFLSIGNNPGKICERNNFFFSPSPYQYITSFVNYLITTYGIRMAFIYDDSSDKSIYNKIILDAIEKLNLNYLVIKQIPYSNSVDNFDVIETFIDESLYHGSENFYIINTLSYDNLIIFFDIYKKRSDIMSVFPVFCIDNSIVRLDSSKTDGSYLVSYEINMSSDEEMIHSSIYQLLGNDYIINGKEISYLIALFFLGESLKSTEILSSDVIIRYLYETKTDTLFGHLEIGKDNTITRSVVLNEITKNGVIFDKFILKTSYEAGVWNDQYIQQKVYSCNWKDSSSDRYERSTIKIGIALSLSGIYSNKDRKLFDVYLMIINYYNIQMKGIRGLIIVPTFVDLKSDVNLVKETLLYLNSNNINSVIGMSNSEMRKASFDTLEENNMILFYPHNYEGIECKRNIIYVGVPFTSHISYRYYIQRDVLQTKNRVAIVYTNNLYYKTAAQIISADLEKIGITVSYLLKTSYDITDMNSIVNEILIRLLGGGIIISLIDGDLKYQFYELMYMNHLVQPSYICYTFGIDSSVLDTKYAKYFVGHYLITEAIEVDNEITDIIKKYKNDYYPYVDSLDNDMYYSMIALIMWREAIENKKSYTTDLILDSVNKLSFESPFGTISSSSNHHLSIPRFIVKIEESNDKKYMFNYHFSSGYTIPNPYSTKYLGDHLYICDWTKSIEKEVSISVNFLIVLSPKNEVSYLSIIVVTVSCIDELNSKNGMIGYKLNPLFIIYNDGDITLKARLENSMIENPLNLLYIGCTTLFCLNTITPLLIKYRRLLLYPIKFQAEICNPTILATGPIPNQIIDSTVTYISSLLITKKIILLYSSDTKWNLFKEVFKNSISDQYTIISENNFDDYSFFSLSMVNNIYKELQNGGFIISFLSEKPLISILNYLNLIIVDTDSIKFEIYNFRVPPFTIQQSLPNLKFPYYYVSGLDNPVEDSKTLIEVKQTLEKYYGNINLTDDSVSVAITIFGLNKVVEAAKTIVIDDVKLYLYTTYLADDKTTKFSTNNYMIRDIYIYKYSENVGTIVRIFQGVEPQSFNWKLEGNYGKMCDIRLVSNFSGNPVITVNILKIILITSTTGSNQYDFRGVSEVFQRSIDNLNSNGGLRSKKIDYEIIDDESDSTICSDSIKNRLNEDNNIVAVFTTGNQLCIDISVNTLTKYKVKLFHIGIFGGESCEANVFHFGIEPTAIERNIEITMNKGITNFGIISTTESYHMKFYNYAQRYIDYLYGNILLATTVEESIQDCSSLATNIITKLPRGNSVILLFVNVNVHILLSKALKDSGINDNEYQIFSFSTYENILYSDENNILPFYSIAHYFTSISRVENTKFIEEIELSLPSNVKINSYHESIYVAVELWENTIREYDNIEIKDLSVEYYNLNLTTAAGYMVIDTNNIVYRNIYTSYYDGNDDGKFTIISNSDYGYPTVWKQFINSGMYICNFADPSIGQKYKSPSISIGVMASLSGDDELRGREIVSSVLLVTRRVNQEGGVIGSRIEVEIYDTQSDFDTYEQKAISISQVSKLSAVFGAAWDDEYKIIIPYFNKAEKLFFFSGIATSEGCQSYGIVSQDTFIQLITVTQYTLVKEGTNKYTILYSYHSFSRENLNIISGFLDSINITYSKYEYDSVNNEIFEEIKNEYPDGVKIIDVGSTWYTLEMSKQAKKAGLEYPKYQFFHFFVDEYIINGNEYYFEGHVFLSSWFAVIGNITLNGYENQRKLYQEYVTTYLDSLKVSASAEATYTSLELWINGVREIYSFEPSKVKKGMLGKKLIAGSSRIKLENNNIVSRKIYTAQIINGVLVLISTTTETIYPYSYANWEVENHGKECDLVNYNGTYFKKKIKKVGIILEADYEVNTEVYNAWISFKDALNEINLVGGIDGVDFFEATAIVPLDDVENSTINLIENEKVFALFGCLTIKCRNIVSIISEKYQIIFFYIGDNDGDYFSKYTFSISSTIIQNLNVALEYTNKYYKYYYLVIDQDN